MPLREAGELFDKEVTFDTETKTAYIGKIPMKNKSTMENPVEMGNIETVEVNDWGYNYKLDVVLNEVMYKDLANEVMQDASLLNKLSYGYEPIVIKVTVSNLQSDEPIDVSSKNFEVICDNRIIDGQDFIAPTPAFEGTINTDESFTGYIIYQVPINQDVVLKWKGSENYFAIK